MSRRNSGAAEAAAAAASEAARVLQARQQESRAQAPAEAAPAPEAKKAEPPEGFRPKLRNEPRRLAMEEIEARDLSTKGISEVAPEPKPAPEKQPDDPPPPTPEDMLQGGKFSPPPEPAAEPSPADAPPATPAPEAIKTIRVKVDGEEFDAPEADVQAAGGVGPYQRQRAEENRLKKFSEGIAELRALQARMAQGMQPQAPAAPKQTHAEFIASKLDVIRFGTPEEAAKAWEEIQQRTNPQVDQNAIISQVQAQLDHTAAVRDFDRKNADLVTNPIILQAIAAVRQTKLRQIQQAQPNAPIDWPKFYDTLAVEVRSAFGRPSQSAPAAPATSGTTSQSPSEKEARKASIVAIPTAAARAELPKEPKSETRADILNDMRKKRGLPTG